jgi:hypothetical protein
VDAFDAPPHCFNSRRDTKSAASLAADLKTTLTAS